MKNSIFIKRTLLTVLATVLFVSVSGLSWAEVKPKEFKEGKGMIYGRVILPSEMKDSITRIQIFKLGAVYAPPFKKTPRVIFSPVDGYFLAENLDPGSYFINEVVAGFESFYFHPPKIKEAKETVKQYAVEVRPNEVTYLGTFEIYDWKRGFQSKMSPRAGKVRFFSTPASGPSTLPNFIAGTSSILAAGAGKFNVKHSVDSFKAKQALQFVLEQSAGTGWDTKI